MRRSRMSARAGLGLDRNSACCKDVCFTSARRSGWGSSQVLQVVSVSEKAHGGVLSMVRGLVVCQRIRMYVCVTTKIGQFHVHVCMCA